MPWSKMRQCPEGEWIVVKGCQFIIVLTLEPSHFMAKKVYWRIGTVVPGFRVLGFSALPGFRALKACDGAWSVHKMLLRFKAPILGS